LSSWGYSLELVTRELELTEKKKQALEDLFTSERISQSTYDYLERELKEMIADLEVHQKSLMEKMTTRAEELEKQIKSLELFLANIEVHHAAGQMEDETYEQQNKAILLGLEAAKQELNAIKTSLMKLTPASTIAPETIEPEKAEDPATESAIETAESEISSQIAPPQEEMLPTSLLVEETDVDPEESTEF